MTESKQDASRYTGEWVLLGPNNPNHNTASTWAMDAGDGVFLRSASSQRSGAHDKHGKSIYDHTDSVAYGPGMKIAYAENAVILVPLDYMLPVECTVDTRENGVVATPHVEISQHQTELLALALMRILKSADMIRQDAALTGPELLMHAADYAAGLHSKSAGQPIVEPDIEKEKGPYTKTISYEFEVMENSWSVSDFGDRHIYCEDLRKNGQEDTHLFAEMEIRDGEWKVSAEDIDQIRQYEGQQLVDALEKFFDEHGPPDAEPSE